MRRIHRAAVIIYILRMRLSGKRFFWGVTGGIAAYKSCELLRLLQKEGAEVRVAMTPAAADVRGTAHVRVLSRYPVFLKSGRRTRVPFQHIEYPLGGSLPVVPCSANTLARFAAGLADEPVSPLLPRADRPRMGRPAMNSAMYLSPAVQANIALLKSRGVKILQAPAGNSPAGNPAQAAVPNRRTFSGRSPPRRNLRRNHRLLRASNGKRVPITAGRTEEPIDPVRYISTAPAARWARLADAFVRAVMR